MNLDRHYILDEEHRPVAVDLMTWARWFENADRRVAETHTKLFRISTVFLGFDHQFGNGPPLIFETMSFERQPHLCRWLDGTLREFHADDEQVRYSTWDDAMAGHNAMVRRYLKREEEAAAAIIKAEQMMMKDHAEGGIRNETGKVERGEGGQLDHVDSAPDDGSIETS